MNIKQDQFCNSSYNKRESSYIQGHHIYGKNTVVPESNGKVCEHSQSSESNETVNFLNCGITTNQSQPLHNESSSFSILWLLTGHNNIFASFTHPLQAQLCSNAQDPSTYRN